MKNMPKRTDEEIGEAVTGKETRFWVRTRARQTGRQNTCSRVELLLKAKQLMNTSVFMPLLRELVGDWRHYTDAVHLAYSASPKSCIRSPHI